MLEKGVVVEGDGYTMPRPPALETAEASSA